MIFNNQPVLWSKLIGHFFEIIDPLLTFIAYKKSAESCNDEIVEIVEK